MKAAGYSALMVQVTQVCGGDSGDSRFISPRSHDACLAESWLPLVVEQSRSACRGHGHPVGAPPGSLGSVVASTEISLRSQFLPGAISVVTIIGPSSSWENVSASEPF